MTLYKLEKYSNVGPFVLRIAAGLIFLLAGWTKLAGIAGTAEFFGGLGIPAAGFAAWLVGLVELIGGLMLILGVLVRYAAIPLGVIMLVALFTAKGADVLGAGRLDLALLAIMVALVFLGAGRWALYSECKKHAKK